VWQVNDDGDNTPGEAMMMVLITIMMLPPTPEQVHELKTRVYQRDSVGVKQNEKVVDDLLDFDSSASNTASKCIFDIKHPFLIDISDFDPLLPLAQEFWEFVEDGLNMCHAPSLYPGRDT
ncbi:hypothetical protein HAX54_021727, partial [Datura stramonium]|nr:hypothetical protein [Datura stramonium]